MRETARFAIPAGTAAGLGVVASYLFSLNVADLPLRDSRTVAATVLLVVGLYLVLALEASAGRRGVAVTILCVLMGSLYVLVWSCHGLVVSSRSRIQASGSSGLRWSAARSRSPGWPSRITALCQAERDDSLRETRRRFSVLADGPRSEVVTLGQRNQRRSDDIRDIMTTNVFTVPADMPLKQVATRMLEYGISGLPVIDEEQCVVGVLSETDILYKERTAPKRDGLVDWLVHYGEDPPAAKLNARTAGQAMTSPAVTITPRRSVADAAELMLEVGIDRLPVVDGGQLVGIVTREISSGVHSGRRGRRARDPAKRAPCEALARPDEVGFTSRRLRHAGGRVDDEGVAEQILHCTQRVPGVVSVEPRLVARRSRRRGGGQVTRLTEIRRIP